MLTREQMKKAIFVVIICDIVYCVMLADCDSVQEAPAVRHSFTLLETDKHPCQSKAVAQGQYSGV